MKSSNESSIIHAPGLGIRHVQQILLFLVCFLAYGMRTNLSVGIVAMMDKDPPDPNIPTYPEWTNKDILLSSFFWGYVIPQIGAGQFAEKYGPKWILAGGFGINSLASLLIPTLASVWGSYGVLFLRIVQGLTQSVVYPSAHNLLSHWTPLTERSRIVAFVYSGGALGTAFSMAITGIIANSPYGWPYAFYLYGLLGFVWITLWIIFGANCPAEQRMCSEKERKYIEATSQCHTKRIPTPWRYVLRSPCVWAIALAHFGFNWGYWTLTNELPSYFNSILKFDIKHNSLESALPYVIYAIFGFLMSACADFLISRQIRSIQFVRKAMTVLSFFVPAVALLFLGYVSSNKTLAIVLLNIVVGCSGAMLVGFNVNHIDISPNHAGTLMGITNGLASVASIFGTLLVSVVVRDETDQSQWRTIFFIASGLLFVSGTFFDIFASGQVQHWNDLSQGPPV